MFLFLDVDDWLWLVLTLHMFVFVQSVRFVNQVERLDEQVLLRKRQAIGTAETMPFLAGANCRTSRI